MGYDITRFQGSPDEELICPICSGVLEDAVQAPQCEHAFCSACINEWLSRQQTCPVDRSQIMPGQMKPASRILRNLLSRLNIACDNARYGCTAFIKLENLTSHVLECEHNPKKLVHCDVGCGLLVAKDELPTHNCVKQLRSSLDLQRVTSEQQQVQIAQLQSEISDLKLTQTLMTREIHVLKEYMRALRQSNPRIRDIQAEVEQNDIHRWLSTLQPARVTRWGGMISTPDAVLQALIKRSLIDSGCPAHVVNDLMENAHERRWPPGLCTLEMRQMNRRQYENYVSKRIPGKQAVIVMACENQHMAPSMIVDPGLVMIFAHGVD